MSVSMTGSSELMRKMQQLGDKMQQVADSGTWLTANDVRTAAIKSIQTQSMGRTVRRSKQGGGGTYSHVAARKGDAPNTDTGAMVASVANEKIGQAHYEVGSNLRYAAILELTGWPWLKPALELEFKNLEANIAKVADIEIKRLGI